MGITVAMDWGATTAVKMARPAQGTCTVAKGEVIDMGLEVI